MNGRLLLCASAFALAFVVSLTSARANEYGGQCSVSRTAHTDKVSLQLKYEKITGSSRSIWEAQHDVLPATLKGFSLSDLTQPGTHRFTVTTDPGDIVCTAVGGYDGMAGTFDFVPSPGFANGLRSRGIGLPTPEQQIELAISNFSLSSVDMLLRDGFERPTIEDLFSMAGHGVSNDYIAAMSSLRITPKTVKGLIEMHDHGVSADFAKTVVPAFPGTDADALVQARDHGVTADYAVAIKRLWPAARLSDLVRLRDHGVSVAYIERLKSHGYSHLTIDDIIRLRDNGV